MMSSDKLHTIILAIFSTTPSHKCDSISTIAHLVFWNWGSFVDKTFPSNRSTGKSLMELNRKTSVANRCHPCQLCFQKSMGQWIPQLIHFCGCTEWHVDFFHILSILKTMHDVSSDSWRICHVSKYCNCKNANFHQKKVQIGSPFFQFPFSPMMLFYYNYRKEIIFSLNSRRWIVIDYSFRSRPVGTRLKWLIYFLY